MEQDNKNDRRGSTNSSDRRGSTSSKGSGKVRSMSITIPDDNPKYEKNNDFVTPINHK